MKGRTGKESQVDGSWDGWMDFSILSTLALHILRVPWNFMSQPMNKAFMFCLFRTSRRSTFLTCLKRVAESRCRIAMSLEV
jgi:hypothetical protein